jgi:hypothetical protein
MSLIRVYKADFAAAANPSPFHNDAQVATAPACAAIAGAGADNTVFSSYKPVKCHAGADGGYASIGWRPELQKLWRDTNHLPVGILHLAFIFRTSPLAGAIGVGQHLPTPMRPLENGLTVNSLQLKGAEIRFAIHSNHAEMPKHTTFELLVQSFDFEANEGRGINVNYIVSDGPSIDKVAGFKYPNHRTGPDFLSSTAWKSVVINCPTVLEKMVALNGRPDKVEAEIYGMSKTADDLWNGELLNLQLVMFTGFDDAAGNPVVPTPEPLALSGGGWSEWYIRNFEVWVNPVLNPNAIEI